MHESTGIVHNTLVQHFELVSLIGFILFTVVGLYKPKILNTKNSTFGKMQHHSSNHGNNAIYCLYCLTYQITEFIISILKHKDLKISLL